MNLVREVLLQIKAYGLFRPDDEVNAFVQEPFDICLQFIRLDFFQIVGLCKFLRIAIAKSGPDGVWFQIL